MTNVDLSAVPTVAAASPVNPRNVFGAICSTSTSNHKDT
jgi:hypothetical protein